MPAGAPYVGRFAPSPTGSLHLGSLVAALGSYLDARHHGGRWLVRMEDLDTPRVLPGCADRILETLESFGLEWDGPVEYQSRRLDRYDSALRQLRSGGHIFQCLCTRRMRAEAEDSGYPGTCRALGIPSGTGTARFRVDNDRLVEFADRFQGPRQLSLQALGDVVLQRRDGVFAYQLAVVVDDAEQGITDVVRGSDLIDSTGWQIVLQEALGLPRPRYGHLPMIVEPDGAKLSKSKRSLPLDPERAGRALLEALSLLQQSPERGELARAEPSQILQWARARWNPRAFQGVSISRTVN